MEIAQKISAKNFPENFLAHALGMQPYQVEVLRELMEIAEKNFPKPLVLFSTSRREGHFYRIWREADQKSELFFCGVDHAIPESEKIVLTKGRGCGKTEAIIIVDEIAEVVRPKIEPRNLVFAHDVLVLGTQAGKTKLAEEELAKLAEKVVEIQQVPAEEPDDIPFWKKIRGKNFQKKFGRYAPGRSGR